VSFGLPFDVLLVGVFFISCPFSQCFQWVVLLHPTSSLHPCPSKSPRESAKRITRESPLILRAACPSGSPLQKFYCTFYIIQTPTFKGF